MVQMVIGLRQQQKAHEERGKHWCVLDSLTIKSLKNVSF